MDWERLLSHKRLGLTKDRANRPGRPDFQRDADKVAFSAAFRRLQGKTQVHLVGSDYARNRLTHSLETSRVGRSLGNLVGQELADLGLLPAGFGPFDLGDCVEAACLAHDIGTVAWGHAGESTVQDWFRTSPIAETLLTLLSEDQKTDFLRFEGNALGFRMLTRGPNGLVEDGLKLTHTTLAAVVKYPNGSFDAEGCASGNAASRKFNFFHADLPLYAEIADELGLARTERGGWVRHPLVYLTEAADDICYSVVDLEDAYKLGYLSYDEIIDLYRMVLESADADWFEGRRGFDASAGTAEERDYNVQTLRGLCIGLLVDQAVTQFMLRHDLILEGRYAHEILEEVPAAPALGLIGQVSRQRIFDHPKRIEDLIKGHDTLVGLLNSFGHALAELSISGGGTQGLTTRSRYVLKAHPTLFEETDTAYQRLLRMADYLAAMTDHSAVQHGILLGSAALVMPSLDRVRGEAWNSAYHA